MLFSNFSHSQWTNQNPVPSGNDLWSTCFVDDNTGWIVGSDGFIKKTTNAGIDWLQQNSNTKLILKSVQFINQKTGWICGESGLILKTTDGGVNWDPVESGTTEHLTDIHFYDANIGYIVGFGGTILKSNNGGKSWRTLSSGTSIKLNSVDFFDALLGYAVGGEYGSYAILKTTDGGVSWSNRSSGLTLFWGKLIDIEVIDNNMAFIGGGELWTNAISKTTDGGDTWIPQGLPPTEKNKENNIKEELTIYNFGGINSIFFKDSNVGYAVGGDYLEYSRSIFTTTDGGTTWNLKYVGYEEAGLISVYVNNAGQGWVVGFKGVIFITDDDANTWKQILSGKGSGCGSGDELYSVFCLDEDIGWVVGRRKGCTDDGPIILNTTNGGQIWQTQLYDQNTARQINSVYFIDENIGWAVGEGNTGFYWTTDGGNSWMEGDGVYSAVFFIDQYNGWATNDVNSTGIYKSVDGGITWIQKSSVSCSSIYFADLNTGWAVGEGGIIIKSTDSGETWITKTSGTTIDLKCVKFLNEDIGMCVGNSGIILLSTDGGETWVIKNTETIYNLNAITFTNSSSAWIVGANGTILNTTDLGISWTSYDEVTDNDLTSLCFISENTGWIGGRNGSMFKYHNSIVPVELISFTANVDDNLVQLNWQTVTETNNYGFEIDRYDETEKWNNIGFTEGHGNSSSPNSYSFIDRNITGGVKFRYRLKQIDFDGEFKYSNEIEVEIIPGKFVLNQNYPNPFNPSTKIRWQSPISSRQTLKIYDVLGNEALTLVDEYKQAGRYEVELDASDLPSGIYFYQLKIENFVETKKMVLLK
jgi:photosystem II stability/assembly factor-like uncharacterized protein